jgi:hypothetical protein
VRSIVVLEESHVLLAGIECALHALNRFRIVHTGSHRSTEAWTSEWRSIDVLIVGGVDPGAHGDQFPGVRAVQRFREHRPLGAGRVIVVSGMPEDGRVHRRFWEAEADALVGWYDLRESADLLAVIDGTAAWARLDAPRPRETFDALGIVRTSRVNRFVQRVEEIGPQYLTGEAPDGAPPQRARWWSRLRQDLTDAGALRVVNRDGTLPDRNQAIASLAQLRRVHEWATRL